LNRIVKFVSIPSPNRCRDPDGKRWPASSCCACKPHSDLNRHSDNRRCSLASLLEHSTLTPETRVRGPLGAGRVGPGWRGYTIILLMLNELHL